MDEKTNKNSTVKTKKKMQKEVVKKNAEEVKKSGIKLTGKLVGIVISAMIVLAIAIIITVLTCMKNLAKDLVEDKLEVTSYAVKSHYDSLSSFDYKIGTDGMLYRGTTDLTYKKDYIYEMRDNMDTYTVMFYGEKAYISSFINSDGSANVSMMLSNDIIKAVDKNGYYFVEDLEINGETYYGYYKGYAFDQEGKTLGIVLVAVESEKTWSSIATYLIIISAIIIAIVLATIIILGLFVRAIIKVIKKSVGHMEDVSKGYLNFKLADKMVTRKDEVGDMARGIQQIISNFKSVVTKIFEASESLAQFSGKFGESFGKITETMDSVNIAVNEIATTLVGPLGLVLAIIGVVICPITTGDTALRSARITIADELKIDQTTFMSRFKIAFPLFVISFALTFFDFSLIWRYMAWAQLFIAVAVLLAATVYLIQNKKHFIITFAPAIVCTVIAIAYILQAPEGLRLDSFIANLISVILTAIISIVFIWKYK